MTNFVRKDDHFVHVNILKLHVQEKNQDSSQAKLSARFLVLNNISPDESVMTTIIHSFTYFNQANISHSSVLDVIYLNRR